MTESIKTDSMSPEEALPSTAKTISELKHLLYIFEILFHKSREITLSFIELKKRNPLLQDKVSRAEESFQTVFLELLDEIQTLNEVLISHFEEKGDLNNEHPDKRPV
jgi:hypothetical protein